MKVELYNFENTSLVEKWDVFKDKIENSDGLKNWFVFFECNGKEIRVINPLSEDKKLLNLSELKLTSAEYSLLEEVKAEVLGIPGDATSSFSNVFVAAHKIKEPDCLFAAIMHEMTHYFEQCICGDKYTIYNKLNKLDQKKYREYLSLQSVDGDKDLNQLVTCQRTYTTEDNYCCELLTYAIEAKSLCTLRNKKVKQKNSDSNFSLAKALEIAKNI